MNRFSILLARSTRCSAYTLAIVSSFFLIALTRCGEGEVALTQSEYARLEIAGGLSYEFPLTNAGESSSKEFSVTNTGSVAAMEVSGEFFVSAFGYVGGSYPGDGASCGDVIEAGETCTVHVSFSPPYGTDYESPLRLKYFNGANIVITTHPVLYGTGIGEVEVVD